MRALFLLPLALTFAVTIVACETGSPSDLDDELSGPVDALGAKAAAGGVPQRTDAAAPKDAKSNMTQDAQSNQTAVCVPGQSSACECVGSGNMALSGTKICLESTGVYTQCGCAFEHPYPGPTCKDGKVKCRPTVNEETQYAARHCCTEAGACGLTNPDVTGGKCIASGTEPMGKATTACGETVIPFIQSADCCRPDNKCGLWLQQGDNWDDLGCVERTGMAALLKNSGTLGLFLFLIGRGEALNEIKGSDCNYAQP